MILVTSTTLTASARPGGLVSVANRIDGEWTRGVDVLIGSTLEPVRLGPCPTEPTNTESPGNVDRFVPVLIRQGVRCSALSGGDESIRFAQSAANATTEYALSQELYDGTATNNPSFADATSLGSANDMVSAIGLLEDAANSALFGRLAVIHVPVGLSSQLDDVIYRDLNKWRTHAGNLVAIHGNGNQIYATGEIWYNTAAVENKTYTDRSINLTEAYSDYVGIVVFDSAFNVYVSLGGTPTSP